MDATGQDPAPDLTEAQWYDPFDSFTATHSYQDTNPVYLRWGRTDHVVLNHWTGWGYRKIAAKHGWSTLVATRVQNALLLPPAQTFGTRWVYKKEYTHEGPLGVHDCRITVVVQYAQETFERTRGYPPAHIINVYSRKI